MDEPVNMFDGEWVSNDKPLYTKLQQGETKLRILSRVLIGWEGWFGNKPVRFRHDYKITPDEYDALDKDNYNQDKRKWRQFGVCVVYNYNDKAVQFWHYTQKQIATALMRLANDSDYGPMSGYDIKVTREGEKMETKYTITPLPPKPLSAEVQKAVDESTLAPEQTFGDEKNLANIEALRKAAGVTKGAEVDPEDIPF